MLTFRDREVQSPLRSITILEGRLGGKEVVVARCGIGKVNAALAAQYVIDRFKPTAIINSGIAGGLSPQVRIGDLVLGSNSLQHDFDLREFGYARSYIPSLGNSHFPGDPGLLAVAQQAAAEEFPKNRVHQGLVVSGDQFISSLEQKQHLSRMFPDALCAEMEGAAIGQVATVNNVPHLIMRAISDLADSTAPDDSDRYISEIIPVLNAVIQKLLALL
jgi:adenosylhomocysteine nucleosidase